MPHAYSFLRAFVLGSVLFAVLPQGQPLLAQAPQASANYIDETAGPTLTSVVTRANLIAGEASLTVVDPVFASNDLARQLVVALVHDELAFDARPATFQLELPYTVVNVSGAVIGQGTLSISRGTDAGTFEDIEAYSLLQNTATVSFGTPVSTLGASSTAVTPANADALMPTSIRAEVRLRTFPDAPATLASPARPSLLLRPTNGHAAAAWTTVQGAGGYEVQWAFSDARDNANYPTDELFGRRGLSAHVDLPYYDLPATYPSGTIHVRVRATQADGATTGPYSPVATLTLAGGRAFAKTHNWQATHTFAEDGKSKTVVSYFDDALRSRQVVTDLSTDHLALVGTTQYDPEGRPVVQVLPVPDLLGDPLAPVNLLFRPRFNRVGGQALNFTHYTPLATGPANGLDAGCAPVPASRLDNTTGAGRYYDPAGLDDARRHNLVHPGWTPDADGYPYSVMRYLNDGTGRLAEQGGVGAAFQPGNSAGAGGGGGHTTRYAYDDASAEQLQRLFGTNVGDARHYRRHVVTDPNGQMSVSYLDAAGRTVATALAGQGSSHTLPLASNSPLASLTEDLDASASRITRSGFNARMQDCDEAITTVVAESTEPISIADNLGQTPASEIDCPGCQFDYELSVRNACGDDVAGPVLETLQIASDCNTLTPVDFSRSIPLTWTPESVGEVFTVVRRICVLAPTTAELTAYLDGVDPDDLDAGFTPTNDFDCAQLLTQCPTGSVAECLLAQTDPAARDAVLEATFDVSVAANVQRASLLQGYRAPEPGLEPSITTTAQGCVLAAAATYTALLNNFPFADLEDYGLPADIYNPNDDNSDNPTADTAERLRDYIATNPSWPTPLEDYLLLNHPLASLASFRQNFTAPSDLVERALVFAEGNYPAFVDLLELIEANPNVLPGSTFTPAPSFATLEQLIELFPEFRGGSGPIAAATVVQHMNDVYAESPTSDPNLASCPGYNSASAHVFSTSAAACIAGLPGRPVTALRRFQGLFVEARRRAVREYEEANFGQLPCYQAPFAAGQASGATESGPLADFAAIPTPGSGTLLNPAELASLYAEGSCTVSSVFVDHWMRRLNATYQGCQQVTAGHPVYQTIRERLTTYLGASCAADDNPAGIILLDDPRSATLRAAINAISCAPTAAIDFIRNRSEVYACTPPPGYGQNGTGGGGGTGGSGAGSASATTPPAPCNRSDIRTALGAFAGLVNQTQQFTYNPTLGLLSIGSLSSLANLGPTQIYFDNARQIIYFVSSPNGPPCKPVTLAYQIYSDPGADASCSSIYFQKYSQSAQYYATTQFGGVTLNDIGNYFAQFSTSCANEVIRVRASYASDLSVRPDPAVPAESIAGASVRYVCSGQVTCTTGTGGGGGGPRSLGDLAAWCRLSNPDIYGPVSTGRNAELLFAACNAELAELAAEEQLRDRQRRSSELLAADLGGRDCLGAITSTATITTKRSEHHYTLYYYDQAGNLAATVPPAGVKPDGSGIHTLLTTYAYNSLGQLTEATTPDAATTRTYYDYAQRPRLTQDAVQRANNTFSYMRYDPLGRIIDRGEYHAAPSLSQLDNAAYPASGDATLFYDRTLTTYSRRVEPTFDYGAHVRGRIAQTQHYSGHYHAGDAPTERVDYRYDAHGNVAALQRKLDVTGPYPMYMEYDYDLVSGNVRELRYNPRRPDGLTHRYRYDADNRLTHAYTNVASGALSYAYRDQATLPEELHARYRYYAHGPLARLELGHDAVQGLDYRYTLQGWIKGVNAAAGGAATNGAPDAAPEAVLGGDVAAGGGGGGTLSDHTGAFGADAYDYGLAYYTGDYASIDAQPGSFAPNELPTPGGQAGSAGLYNGNIAAMRAGLTLGRQASGAPQPRSPLTMRYQYDQLHRIRSAASAGGLGAAYSYDPNGNLRTLMRRASFSELSDNLTYTYTPGTNRLAAIKENSSDTRGVAADAAFTYDARGNLTADGLSGRGVAWNHDGKVASVAGGTNPNGTSGGLLAYRYDAQGNRLVKQLPSSGQPYRYYEVYARDASGNTLAKYNARHSAQGGRATYCYIHPEDGQVCEVPPPGASAGAQPDLSVNVTEQELYGSSRLGTIAQQRRVYASSGDNPPPPGANAPDALGARSRGRTTYELSNHLGNVLSSVSDMAQV